MVDINNSTIPISYKEFTQVIPANGQVTIQQPYNYFRLLDSNVPASQLRFRFGSVATETEMSYGLGWGLKDKTFASVTIRNLGSGAATIRVSFAEGEISDARLTVSGTVNVQNQPLSTAAVSLATFPAGGSISIDSTSYKKVVIQNNSTTNSIFIFNNNTCEILPNGSFELDIAATFTVYGTAGEKITVGYFA